MRVLTVYAHPNPTSFCHAVLDRFTGGLEDAGTRARSSISTRSSSIPCSGATTTPSSPTSPFHRSCSTRTS